MRIDVLDGEEESLEISLSVPEEYNRRWISEIVWSGDSQRLAIGRGINVRSAEAPIVIAYTSGQILHQFSGGVRTIDKLLWSPDDRFLLAIDAAHQIMVYDTEAGMQFAANRLHSLVGDTLAWSPNGSQIALGDTINSVQLWEMTTNTPTRTLSDNDSVVSRIEWQITGEHLALETQDYLPLGSGTMTYRRAQVWRLSGEAPERVTASFQPDSSAPLNIARFSADGTHLLVGAFNNLWVWRLDADAQQLVRHETLDYLPVDLLFGPSGDHVVYQEDIHGGAPPFRTQEQQQEFWIFLVPYSDRVNTWSRSGELVSLIWDVWDHTYIPEIEPSLVRLPAGGVEDLSSRYFMLEPRLYGSIEAIDRGFISPYGAYVGAVSGDGNGMIWDGQTGSPVAWINDAANMVWSLDETRLVVQRTDGSLWILESDGTILAQIPTSPDMQTAVGNFYWSPDSQQLAHLHDGVIDVWQVSM